MGIDLPVQLVTAIVDDEVEEGFIGNGELYLGFYNDAAAFGSFVDDLSVADVYFEGFSSIYTNGLCGTFAQLGLAGWSRSKAVATSKKQ